MFQVMAFGCWLNDRELFMSYEDFPWFRDVPVGKILNVEEPMPGISIGPISTSISAEEIIDHPERFLLRAK